MKFIYTKQVKVPAEPGMPAEPRYTTKRITIPNVIKIDRSGYMRYDVYSYQRGEPRLAIIPKYDNEGDISDVLIKFDNEYEMRTFMAEEDGKNKPNSASAS